MTFRVRRGQNEVKQMRERGRLAVERQYGASDRVEILEVDQRADEREQDRKHVEDAIRLGVLLQRLDRGRLDRAARDPYESLDDDRRAHDGERDPPERLLDEVVVEDPLDRFDKDLEERRDHEDGKDQHAERFHATFTRSVLTKGEPE